MIFFLKLYCDSGGINPLALEGVLCFEVTDLLIKILPHISNFLSGAFTVGSAFYFQSLNTQYISKLSVNELNVLNCPPQPQICNDLMN